MKIQELINGIIKGLKRLIELAHKKDVEKFVFKSLIGIWIFVIFVVVILMSILGPRYNIEKRLIKVATSIKPPVLEESEISRYESIINEIKLPERIEKYTQEIKYDPFSEYKKGLMAYPSGTAQYDFVLKSVYRAQLPLIYKGYIELTDGIIGQTNWRGQTRFVKVGSILEGYKIQNISKKKMEAIDENGKKVEFELNKPVFSDELEAVLFDNISQKSFSVKVAGVIGNYKVIDITADYVILLSDGVEIKIGR